MRLPAAKLLDSAPRVRAHCFVLFFPQIAHNQPHIPGRQIEHGRNILYRQFAFLEGSHQQLACGPRKQDRDRLIDGGTVRPDLFSVYRVLQLRGQDYLGHELLDFGRRADLAILGSSRWISSLRRLAAANRE